jgi:Cytidine and deoxycytidylate deaminase zinc-binding region
MNFRRYDLVIVALWLMDSPLLLRGHSSVWPGSIMHSLCMHKTNSSSENDVTDRMYMRRALELASRAMGKTSPNPCVGCVIVKNGVVVGEGYHKKAGEAHAEVNALMEAGEDAEGSTAYVSLEPCNHFGRTPPCTHALVRYRLNIDAAFIFV